MKKFAPWMCLFVVLGCSQPATNSVESDLQIKSLNARIAVIEKELETAKLKLAKSEELEANLLRLAKKTRAICQYVQSASGAQGLPSLDIPFDLFPAQFDGTPNY